MGARTEPLFGERLYTLCFASERDLAGFVEQLSAFLKSPRGLRYGADPARIEAWGHVDPTSRRWPARLFVSDAAFTAAEAAGLVRAIGDGIALDELPGDSWRVL